jgi:hypothetical protein
MKPSKTFVTIAILALTLVAEGVQPINAQVPNGKSLRSIGGTGTSFVGPGRLPELSCLGLPPGDYTEADWFAGWAQMHVDGAGWLHVAARGTFAWAPYPYADDITGPYDTQHVRLYFGARDINFALIIDPYEPGSTWSYTLPSLVVSGINGTFTLVARPTDPGSILMLTFADSEVGHPDAPGTGIGVSEGQPVCATNQ